ncbi:MAG: hypothetical protein AUJ72_05300 [Candidatus Omnitrophica bacterium CG1_02_46_14]|nr:MAG: hypothetical protein AUJ72_05300 [Candidatus Omnitrophica bacterium CG1_02_46_14]
MISNGVDLIELKKAKNIYRAHKRCLDSFFSLQEIAYIQKSRNAHERFAILLAAKESVFKAVCRLETGLSVFKDIEVVLERGNYFSVKFSGLSKKPKVAFSIIKNKKYVVVQCVGT